MSTPTTVKRMRFEDALTYDTMTYSEWTTNYAKYAIFAVVGTDGILYDVSEWIMELNITHNEIDGENAGRDKKTGKMKRNYVATKHDLQIKIVDGVPQQIAHAIFGLVDTVPESNKYDFTVYYQFPCGNRILSGEFYCSTVNFGAQRYRKSDKRSYYTGMNFKVIEI